MADEPVKIHLPRGWKDWTNEQIFTAQRHIAEDRELLTAELAAGIEEPGQRIITKLLHKLYGRLLWRCHVELARRRKKAWHSTKIDLRR